MDAVVVDERGETLDHDPVPICEPAQAAAHQLYVGVRPPHYLGELAGLPYVVLCRERPDLPLPVHLVAEAPVRYVVGFFVAVRAPQVGPVSIPRAVAILDPGLRLLHGTSAHVDADVRLGTQQSTVLDELVRAESV
jgi:hypothetical protein